MKLALLTDANSPGPFRHLPLDWRVNSVEALAWALDADVFRGTQVNGVVADCLRGYDLVIVNLKHTLWPCVPELAGILGRSKLAGYQEGPSDGLGQLDAAHADQYVEAHRSVGRFFAYDARALGAFAAIANCPTCWLPLPFPAQAYPEPALYPRQPHRIAVHSTPDEARGTFLSVLAAAAPGTEVLTAARGVGEAGIAAHWITRCGGIPRVIPWAGWDRVPPATTVSCGAHRAGVPPMEPVEESPWLAELARCSLAMNLDTAACYGRFVVDCAGLGVPCIGSGRTFMQGALYPELTVADPFNVEPAIVLRDRCAADPAWARGQAEAARRTCVTEFSAGRVRQLFEEALKCPASS